MAKPHQRFFALIIAVLFLATSVAAGVAVLMQIRSDNQESTLTDNSGLDTLQPEEGMLQGTKLEGFTPVDTVSELQIIDLEEGTGEVVKSGARVTAHYTGALANDGTIFQSSHDFGQPIPFGLDEVIRGWGEGVPGMKVGGKRRLLIPYDMAYGEQGSPPSIPARADLVFDIELVDVENPAD